MTATKRNRRPRGGRRPPHAIPSLWAQWLVVSFALLFGTVMTAQAAHLHRPGRTAHLLQSPASGSQSSDTEEHCPLCVAMHPALPAPMHIAPLPALLNEAVPSLVVERTAATAWHFARFGRPPPAFSYA